MNLPRLNRAFLAVALSVAPITVIPETHAQAPVAQQHGSAPQGQLVVPDNMVAVKTPEELLNVVKNEKHFVMLISATYCAACQEMKKGSLVATAQNEPETKFVVVDTDTVDDTLKEIIEPLKDGKMIPQTFMMVKGQDGKFKSEKPLKGYQPFQNIRSAVQNMRRKIGLPKLLPSISR